MNKNEEERLKSEELEQGFKELLISKGLIDSEAVQTLQNLDNLSEDELFVIINLLMDKAYNTPSAKAKIAEVLKGNN